MAQVALAWRVTTPNRPQKITLGEMREAGVRHSFGVAADCVALATSFCRPSVGRAAGGPRFGRLLIARRAPTL